MYIEVSRLDVFSTHHSFEMAGQLRFMKSDMEVSVGPTHEDDNHHHQEKFLGRRGIAVVLVLVLLIGSTQYNLNFAKNLAKPLKTPSNTRSNNSASNEAKSKDNPQEVSSSSSLIKTQYVPPFYNLSSEKHLILTKLHAPGFGNQMQCFQLAAVLAVQYNRTLIVPDIAYVHSPRHGHTASMTVDMVFDTSNIRLSYQTVSSSNVTAPNIPIIRWSPLDSQAGLKLQADPYYNDTVIHFRCEWGFSLFSLPDNLFPQERTNFFPFHKTYQDSAQDIFKQMRTILNFTEQQKMRVLAMHIRRGDCGSWPVLDCTKIKDFPYATTLNDRGKNYTYTGFCGSNEPDENGFRRFNETTPLDWAAFMDRMSDPNCDDAAFPICLSDYDAVFVATNRPGEIRNEFRGNRVTSRLVMMDDVQGDKISSNSESVTRLMVEMLVLAAADTLVVSSRSTITDVMLRMRLEDTTTVQELDIGMNRTFWETLSSAPPG